MENEFLHKINVSKVLEESGLDISGLAKLIDVDEQTIRRWAWEKQKNGNRPKFNAMVRLLQSGVTVETLFGVEYEKAHSLGKLNTPKFLEGLDSAADPESTLNKLMERKVLEMKAKGLI